MQAAHALPNGSVPYYLADCRTKKPKLLDADVVRMHLNGDITINLYAINPEHNARSGRHRRDFDAYRGPLPNCIELKQDGSSRARTSRRGAIYGSSPRRHSWHRSAASIFITSPYGPCAGKAAASKNALRFPASGPDRRQRIRQRHPGPARRHRRRTSGMALRGRPHAGAQLDYLDSRRSSPRRN